MSDLSQITKKARQYVFDFYGIKTADGPEENVHRDAGTFRFNRAAQEADIEDAQQYVFKAHDRKPAATGDESSHGTTFSEGVSG
jgi:hypothetical protein